MMLQDLEINDKGAYLIFNFLGKFSVETGKQCIDAMIKTAIEKRRKKALLDCRKMAGDLPIIARFQIAEYAQKTIGALEKIALVNRPEVVLPDNFVENVAVNRGVNVKIFTDFDEAVRWLAVS